MTMLLNKSYVVLPERLRSLIDEGFLVGDYIRMPDGGQDAHLIQSVLLFFVRKLLHADFLEGIVLVIRNALHMIDTAIGPLTYSG
jgi:hypothetical protein